LDELTAAIYALEAGASQPAIILTRWSVCSWYHL